MVRKPSLIILVFILAVVNLVLLGCSDKPLFIELHSASSDNNRSSWDFSDATDYIFDPSKIEFVDGKAQLKQVNQTHSGTEFDSGVHVGTYFDSNTQHLKILEKTDSSLGVNEILPAESLNLIAYWKMDGNGLDSSSSGSNHNLTASITTFSTDAKVGELSADFSADSKAHLVTPDHEDFDFSTGKPFTVSLWYKFNSDGSTERLIGQMCHGGSYIDTSWVISRWNTNGIAFVHSADGTTISSFNIGETLIKDSWYHFVLSYDGTDISAFQNGEHITTRALPGLHDSSLGFMIGARYSDGTCSDFSQSVDGNIDEVALWKTSLNSEQVASLYRAQSRHFNELSSSWTPQHDNLVGYWKMEGNWQDSSGNEYHGVANGDAGFANVSKVGGQAATFDGTGDYLNVGTSPLLQNAATEMTIMGWVYIDPTDGSHDGSAAYIFDTASGDPALNNGGFFVSFDDRGGGQPINSIYSALKSDSAVPVFRGRDNMIREPGWYHIAMTYNAEVITVYINSVDALSTRSGSSDNYKPRNSNLHLAGQSGFAASSSLMLDEVALFDKALTYSEVKNIYDRQKQKYAGHYDSPIIDLQSSGSWTNINVITSLPFGKEIVAQSTESSSNYPSLSGDLSDGLVGYWPLNEVAANSVGGHDFEDRTTNVSHGNETGGVVFGERGILSNSVIFDGIDDYILTSHRFPNVGDFTISFWAINLGQTAGGSALRPMLVAHDSFDQIGSVASGISISTVRSDYGNPNELSVCVGTAELYVDMNFNDGNWHHVLVAKAGNTVSIYNDGVFIDSFTSAALDIGSDTYFGSSALSTSGGTRFFNGGLDDVAIWERSLTPSEIQQLYRRGANRIKYQVKSCVDSSCECKSFNTAPVGSADDCDGDGTPNSLDFDDIYKAEFVGPGGSGMTAFSELFNRDSGNMTFTCNTNTTDSDNDICVDDEISLTGDSSALPPSFSFANFPSSSRPIDNRYFQYRVLMEAEENTACGGEACLPELTSVEVGPTGRFYAGSPSVVNKTSESLDKALDNLQVSNSSGCNMSYQISNDGNNFYYWDGTSWVTGSQVAESNVLTTLNSNIGTFTEQVGLGDFFFKAYLGNSDFGECELDDIQVIKSSD